MKVYNVQSDNSLTYTLKEILSEIREKRNFNASFYIKEKALLLNKYMNKCGLKSCVVAISGGIDSAITLGIVNYASKMSNSPIKEIKPVLLPLFESSGVTNQQDATNKGIEVCEEFNLDPIIIDIKDVNTSIINSVYNSLEIKADNWALGQLASYSRTPILYYITSLLSEQGLSPIICGTINMDEGSYLGYTGKAGDGMVDLQLISDIHKSEVYKVGIELDIPESIMSAIPTGDMYDGRVDTEVFGASYDFVEIYLDYLRKNKSEKETFKTYLNKETLKQFEMYEENLENLHKYNLHKYISFSPAIHLDLYDASTPGGWINYKERLDMFLNN